MFVIRRCVVAALLLTCACSKLLGIEDRELRPDGPAAGDAGADTPMQASVKLEVTGNLPRFGELAPNTTLPAVTVRVVDSNGNALPDRNLMVMVRLLTSDPAVTMSGTLQKMTVNGVATFDNLAVGRDGSGLRVQALASGASAGESMPFAISPATTLQRFRGSHEVALSVFPSHAIAVDLDDDGDRDIVAVEYGQDVLGVSRSNGDGTFTSLPNTPVGMQPRFVAAGDLDQDGNMDLAVANQATDDVTLLLGNGMAGFESQSSLPACDRPFGVTIADVTNDGRLDLLVGCEEAASVAFYRNTTATAGSTLQFAARADLSNTVGACSTGVATADINRDGRTDIVMTTFCQQLTVALQSSVTANTFLTGQAVGIGGHKRNVAIADLDNDGDLDFASGSGYGNTSGNPVSYALNTTPVGSTTVSSSAPVDLASSVATQGEHWLAAVDADGDERRDLVSAFTNSMDLLLYTNAGGTPVTFGARQTMPLENVPTSIAQTDVDGDGKDDVVLGIAPRSVLILYTNP